MIRNALEESAVFSCTCCGECCRGIGGIVLQHKDSLRLATSFDMDVDMFHTQYAESAHGKYRLRSNAEGVCIFAGPDARCGVHAAKPDVCRAWPFFRGNLVDSVSFAMASDGCPGIVKEGVHADFAVLGAGLLLDNGVFAEAGEEAPPTALMREEELRRLLGGGRVAG